MSVDIVFQFLIGVCRIGHNLTDGCCHLLIVSSFTLCSILVSHMVFAIAAVLHHQSCSSNEVSGSGNQLVGLDLAVRPQDPLGQLRGLNQGHQ